MFKFLLICTFFFLFYLGFIFLGEYDSVIKLNVFNYQIETTLFIIIVVFSITQLIFTIFLKAVFFLLNLPQIIKRRWQKKKLQNINKKLLQIIANLLIDNKKDLVQEIKNLKNDLDEDSQDIINIVMAESDLSFDQKIENYRKISVNKKFSAYAHKKLAEIFYKEGHHIQAEEFAIKSFNENDIDPETMLVLIKIYVSLNLWPKLIFIVSKLKRTSSKIFNNYSNEIAYYYYIAAKHYLNSNDDAQARKYLELSLEIKPDHIESLTLFAHLLINANDTELLFKILKTAFAINPLFEIAKLYIDSSNSQPEEIYTSLANIASPIQNQALFLAIAGYLNLHNQLNEIKDIKLITDNSVAK
ncbi:MAG: hypothetical protein EKK61_04605 [Rickettsiales bacterium]|nr:MAG: hypothetical protein EKK61_04605 [Rickettsiales bacterium]